MTLAALLLLAPIINAFASNPTYGRTQGSSSPVARRYKSSDVYQRLRGGFNSGAPRRGRPLNFLRRAAKPEEPADLSWPMRIKRAVTPPFEINDIEITPDVYAILVVYFVQVQQKLRAIHVYVR